ncbi:helix-turn-helix domain-containing protein [Actinoallomurus sp. CA-142502]|uniref:helix-turn-helix domain-containing protein n=1 Tax=Actinoallomurus sp. CA-142502 TaxID=3239885 RepID=UPI003D8FE6BA
MAAPPDGIEEVFGRRMRRRREELGISTRTFAARMRSQGFEWHHTTVQRVESAKRPARLGEAASIAAILSTELERLLQPETDPAVIAALEREHDAYVQASTEARARLRDAEAERAEHEAHAHDAMQALLASRQRVQELTTDLERIDTHVRGIQARLASARRDLEGTAS